MKTHLLLAGLMLAALAAFAQPQTKLWVNKDARLFVKHYEQTDHITSHVCDDYVSGFEETSDETRDLVLTWDDGKGGQQTWNVNGYDSYYSPTPYSWNSLNTWPATWWPNLVSGTYWDSSGDGGPQAPSILFEQCDQKTKQDYSFAAAGDYYPFPYQDFDGPFVEQGHLTGAPHAQIVLKFYAGGMGLPKRKSVYQASVSAFAHRQTGVMGIFNDPVYQSTPVLSQNITIGDLGTLDPDGILYAAIDDGSIKDITPEVAGEPWFTFGWPALTKYTLISQVSCQALTDPNPERTSLGVAEVVNIGSLPAETTWKTSAGTLSTKNGGGTVLHAPHSAGTATVTATIRNVKLSIDFGVVEPSGISSTIRSRDPYGIGTVGAGMQMDVVIQPTDVSFSQIEMEEPGQATTGITGYFVNNAPPTHSGNGADIWHPVTCGNLISDNLFDNAASYGWPIGVSGSYTWPISPIWMVVGDSYTHPLSGWTDQVMALSVDGTVRVDKLGHNVIRHTFENYGIAQ